MDLISNRLIESSTLALDGLAARNRVLAANIANADTPGYKRSDVEFESQLQKIIGNDREKEQQRVCNSMGINYTPDLIANFKKDNDGFITGFGTEDYSSFNPEYTQDNQVSAKANGNNINIEHEMAESAKNGMQYAAVAQIQEKAFRGLGDIIKGGSI